MAFVPFEKSVQMDLLEVVSAFARSSELGGPFQRCSSIGSCRARARARINQCFIVCPLYRGFWK